MKTADLYKILIDKHNILLNKIEEDFKVESVLEELSEELIFYDFVNLEGYKAYVSEVQGKIREVMKLNYNEDIVDSLISVKINRIIRHTDNLSESTLPTTLNMISLIFDKVLDDFKRHLLMPKEITPVKLEMVKWVREETGCGMMDCKKALENNEWDILKAKEYLENKEDNLCSLTTRRKKDEKWS